MNPDHLAANMPSISTKDEETANDEDESDILEEVIQEVQDFEESYLVCCEAVKQTAEDLISRIRDHEERLLEEVEMRRSTEYKKYGINPDHMKDVGTNVQNKLNCTQLRSIVSTAQNGKSRSPSTLSPPAPVPGPQSVTNRFTLPRLAFTPVRCNTAFGVIDTESEINGKSETPCSKRRSVSVTTLPQNGAGVSPSLRHKTTSASLKNRKSLCSLWSDSDTQSVSRTPLTHVSLRSSKLNSGSTGEVSPDGEKLLRRKFHSMREKDFVRLVSPRFSSTIRQRYSRASSNENMVGCQLLWQVTEEGDGFDQLRCPTDAKFLPDGRCVIADRDNERICIYSNKGQCVKVIAKGKVKPRRLTVTKDGLIAVTDSKENIIKIYDTSGHQVASWGKKIFKNLFKSPCGIAIMSSGHYVVSDLERHTVGIYTSEGKLHSYLGYSPGKDSPKKGQSEFHSPSYIHVDTKDNIVISDSWNRSVKVYKPSGKLSFQFNKLNDDGEDLKYPNGVTTDKHGNMLIADWGSHTVSVFDCNGQFKRHLVGRNDLIHHPAGIDVAAGRLAITEFSENHSSIRVYEMATEQKQMSSEN